MDAVTIGCGLAAALLGLAGSLWLLRRTPAGTTWEDWQRAPKLGGQHDQLIGAVAAAATGVAVWGFGAPDVLRAVLFGLVFGCCGPWFVEGVRRKRLADGG